MKESFLTSRRSILRVGVASLSAAALTGTPLFAAEDAAKAATDAGDPWKGLKVGIATYSFREFKIDETISGIQKIGLKYCSIKDMHVPFKLSAEDRKKAADQFRAAGITPLSCGNITMKNDEADVRRAFQYAKDIGVDTIVCAPDPDSVPILDKMVKEFGTIRLAIHNHGPEDKHFPSPYDVMKAIEKFDKRIGLCIDVGHSARAGAEPAKAIRELQERVYDCHLKDLVKIEVKSNVCEVGRGVLDIKGIFQALLDMKFTGHAGFEYEKDGKAPLPGMIESVDYCKKLMAALTAKA